MTVEMEMTQERIAKLEVIIDVATKAINRKKSELYLNLFLHFLLASLFLS
jgi:hypothetical protein